MPFIITLLCVALLAADSLNAASGDAAKPNLVVILSDDVGFSDIGCYGSDIETPNLDALAKNGLRFTQFYNTARCCPTRASLLTGRYPHQAGVGHMMEDRGLDGYRGRLNRSPTIPEVLKTAGYRSYAVGKWHVTPGHTAGALANPTNQAQWPLRRGFDRFYGTIHGAGSFWDPSSLVRDDQLITIANDPEYQPMEYFYTDAIADHAVKFVREHERRAEAKPFFLYVAFTAAHWPLHSREKNITKYKGKFDEGYEAIRAARWAKQKKLGIVKEKWGHAAPAEDWRKVKDKEFEVRCMEVYAAQLDAMDQAIGRIMAELQAQGEFENTLILYLQDNGGCAEPMGRGTNFTARAERPRFEPMEKDAQQYGSVPKQTRDGWPVRQGYGVMPGPADTYIAYGRGWANVSNTPFREYKHWVHEGGIATPLIAHWPAGIPRSRRNDLETQSAHLVDVMATIIDLAGADYSRVAVNESKPEGVSLRRAFRGRTLQRKEPIFWEHESNRALRDGKWKLVSKENKPWELYNMEQDRTEQHNLAARHPKRVKEMAEKWEAEAARQNVLPVGAWREPRRASR
ncbi:MAG: arylsulfatase [Limisphaerales bacterium]